MLIFASFLSFSLSLPLHNHTYTHTHTHFLSLSILPTTSPSPLSHFIPYPSLYFTTIITLPSPYRTAGRVTGATYGTV